MDIKETEEKIILERKKRKLCAILLKTGRYFGEKYGECIVDECGANGIYSIMFELF